MSNRIVRASARAVSPSREILKDAGLTRHSPIRSGVVAGRSMLADYINALPSSRELLYSPRLGVHFRIFQSVSDSLQDFPVLSWVS
jgi:hypothetical protein